MNQVYSTAVIIPFTYLVQIALTANQAGQQQLTMAADSVFELLRILAVTDADDDAFPPNNFAIQITDSTTSHQMSNARVPQAIYTAYTYQGPGNDEKYPIRFPAQAQVLFDFLNLTSGTINVSVALKGYKIYQTGC